MIPERLSGTWRKMQQALTQAGDILPPLALRMILFWEFWEAGIGKFRGDNWFWQIPWADWQKGFPFPFSQFSDEFNWLAATWGELILSTLLMLGLFTRFAALGLIVITLVATAAVHWPAEWGSLGQLWQGYVITSKGYGNFKLPLLFIIMLLPLLFRGGGLLSIDYLLDKRFNKDPQDGGCNYMALTLVFFLPFLVLLFLEPWWSIPFLLLAALSFWLGKR